MFVFLIVFTGCFKVWGRLYFTKTILSVQNGKKQQLHIRKTRCFPGHIPPPLLLFKDLFEAIIHSRP